jgi:hypothetical protein
MGFQIQHTELRVTLSILPEKDGTEIHHEERQVGGIGHRFLFDIHEVTQTPILLGVTEVELDLKAQGVVIIKFLVRQFQVGAEQNHMGLLLCRKVGFQNHHDIDREGKLAVAQSDLIDLGADPGFFVIPF